MTGGAMLDRLIMWTDAMVCFRFPHAAHWNVVVVDRIDGSTHPVMSALFRWRRSADYWIKQADATWRYRGMSVKFEARPVRWAAH